MNPTIPLRAPSSPPTPALPPPPLKWLAGPWNVTHSTLPMWRKNRNVVITYTPIAHTSPVQIDDLVEYQALGGAKRKKVRGVDTPAGTAATGSKEDRGEREAEEAGDGGGHGGDAGQLASLSYHWRGKGLLFIATSKWEILGWGAEPPLPSSSPTNVVDSSDPSNPSPPPNDFIITHFAATLFTPAGLDIYARHAAPLRPDTLAAIKEALAALSGEVAQLAGGLFEIVRD